MCIRDSIRCSGRGLGVVNMAPTRWARQKGHGVAFGALSLPAVGSRRQNAPRATLARLGAFLARLVGGGQGLAGCNGPGGPVGRSARVRQGVDHVGGRVAKCPTFGVLSTVVDTGGGVVISTE